MRTGARVFQSSPHLGKKPRTGRRTDPRRRGNRPPGAYCQRSARSRMAARPSTSERPGALCFVRCSCLRSRCVSSRFSAQIPCNWLFRSGMHATTNLSSRTRARRDRGGIFPGCGRSLPSRSLGTGSASLLGMTGILGEVVSTCVLALLTSLRSPGFLVEMGPDVGLRAEPALRRIAIVGQPLFSPRGLIALSCPPLPGGGVAGLEAIAKDVNREQLDAAAGPQVTGVALVGRGVPVLVSAQAGEARAIPLRVVEGP